MHAIHHDHGPLERRPNTLQEYAIAPLVEPNGTSKITITTTTATNCAAALVVTNHRKIIEATTRPLNQVVQSSLTLSALKDFCNRDDAGFRSKQAGRLQQPDASQPQEPIDVLLDAGADLRNGDTEVPTSPIAKNRFQPVRRDLTALLHSAVGFKSEVVDTYPEYGVAYLHQTELDSFLAGACADLDDTT
ncbi:ankyrin repeat [Cordyceps militaris]|uniref:Ankyrin repeat n=1 Tax=Cordyceps militaris TaxID=73501 RepID=A0A2H4SDK6_CORMI|nr:ankyrin repeat [Cordyceps militaris]